MYERCCLKTVLPLSGGRDPEMVAPVTGTAANLAEGDQAPRCEVCATRFLSCLSGVSAQSLSAEVSCTPGGVRSADANCSRGCWSGEALDDERDGLGLGSAWQGGDGQGSC